MFWNSVNNACYLFTAKFKHAPAELYLSRSFYDSLEKEMYGEQWWHLVKHNSVRGLKVVIDDNQKLFAIKGKKGCELVITEL